ncbi:MAG: UDP-N-acetylmuramate dehydrogenase [Micrococcales bacterium]|nr:UDP-N-acetylmuramate dehydrogenase [Micrococcales bacterium]
MKLAPAGRANPGLPRPELADLTTMRVGGPVQLVDAHSEGELIEALHLAGPSALVLGGGSNVVGASQLADLTVIRDRRTTINVEQDANSVTIIAQAGGSWDHLVALAADLGWSGFEALSGIPGSVGATPVQNVGAYGHEVAELIEAVLVYDRLFDRVEELPKPRLGFGYRDSALKRSIGRFGHSPSQVVLEVRFHVKRGAESAPIAYSELAQSLDVPMGTQVPAGHVRQAVLELRRSKGMVLEIGDQDTWSAGSFFTNPVLGLTQAKALPAGAPSFPAGQDANGQALVKTSAAWLISRAGIAKGWGLVPRATTSTKHVLALTNRGGATGEDIFELAKAIQTRVKELFEIDLVPEPVLVGFDA